jgi:fused signal recognition particle receptor
MGFFDRLLGKPEPAAETRATASRGRSTRTGRGAGGVGGAASPASSAGLKRTAQLLNTDIRDLFKQEGRLVDDHFLDDLFALLIRTDMGTAGRPDPRPGADRLPRPRGQHGRRAHAVKAKLKELMAQAEHPMAFAESGPTSSWSWGSTAAARPRRSPNSRACSCDQGKRVVLAAADTFRAAAVQQLTIWAERDGSGSSPASGSDPASVAHRAVAQAMESGAEVCIIDTAGRLQTQANLMSQLSKIRRVITQAGPEAPHEVLLVLDATAGQNGISQAKGFSDAAGCTGIVLAKLDGTAKGGVVIPIRQQFNLPVKYVGLGEKGRFVEALFDG